MLRLIRSRVIRRVFVFASCAALGAALVTAEAPQAQAKSQEVAYPGMARAVATITMPMRVVRFDKAVARAHGYKIVAHHGVSMSVAAGRVSAAPDNTVGGNCGTSWIYLTGGNFEYQYYTGFTIKGAGYDFYWDVNIYGPNAYDNHRTWGYLLKGATKWRGPASGDYQVPVDDGGYYRGYVNTGSYAVLDNGAVCYSGGPSSTTKVTANV